MWARDCMLSKLYCKKSGESKASFPAQFPHYEKLTTMAGSIHISTAVSVIYRKSKGCLHKGDCFTIYNMIILLYFMTIKWTIVVRGRSLELLQN